jgi:endoglucanase
VIALDDGTRTPIAIGDDVYSGVLPLVGQFLAEQRCGPTTKAVSLHDACHLFRSVPGGHSGDGVAVDDGKAPPYKGAPAVDVEGGWHDAGDFIKFTGTTSYTLAVELMALRDHRAALGASGNALADQLRWGLDWLLKMEAGHELYHQVAGEGDHDPDWRLPEGDTQKAIPAYDQRPAFRMAAGRGRNILGRSAAAFAFGSQVYKQDAAYSAKLLAAAKKTYALAKQREGVQNPDPPEFYHEDTGDDDLVLAAGALARVTGDAAYAKDAYAFGAKLHPEPGSTVSWHSVDAVALLEAARAWPAGSPQRTELAQKLEALAAPLAAAAQSARGPGAGFGAALPDFGNNSTPESLGLAATCAAAKRLNGTAGCDVVERRQLHWVFGENPFGISFLVGGGTAWPHNVHHSFGVAAHVAIPGALTGGPTALRVLEHSKLALPPKDDPYAMWSTDDLLYEDKADDYVCNEPAIDFAAALVFTLGELADAG